MSSHQKITKPEDFQKANENFLGFDVDVIEDRPVWISVIGSDKSCSDFVNEKLMSYSSMVNTLAKHSKVSLECLHIIQKRI